MRVLLLVLLACTALAGLIAWRVGGIAAGKPAMHANPAPEENGADDAAAPVEATTNSQFPAGQADRNQSNRSPGRAPEHAVAAVPADTTAPLAPDPSSAEKGPIRWAGQGTRRRWQQQLTTAKAALAAEPSNAAALDDALQAARQLERWHDVRELLARRVVEEPDNREARLEYVSVLMRQQLWMEAVTELRVLVDAQPQDELSWFNLAVAYQALGRLGEARTAWDELLAVAPDHSEARARRGEVLLDLGLWAEAAADFRVVLAAQPDSIDAAINLSSALWKNHDPEGARAVLEKLVAQAPTNVLALNRLAELLWKERGAEAAKQAARAKQAETLCRSSLALNPQQPDVESLLRTITASR